MYIQGYKLILKNKGIGLIGFVGLFIFVLNSCSNNKTATRVGKKTATGEMFYKVGHRGAAGLMPENTIPAMKKGLDEGANAIEFDVHITKDHKVIVYHDASANPQYTSLPDAEITEENRNKYIFYKMNYAQIESLRVGKNRGSYPEQEDISTTVPLLTTLIDSVEAYTSRQNMQPPVYLLEIKSSATTDGEEQPPPKEYVRILMQSLNPWLKPLGDRLIIQSFDMRPLRIIRKGDSNMRIGYLTGSKNPDLHADIKALGGIPEFYNPQYKEVTSELLKQAHERGIKVFPWTVNTTEGITILKKMGVDGIITDYPNYF